MVFGCRPTRGLSASGLFLGTSELEIRYTDYLVKDLDPPVAAEALIRFSRPGRKNSQLFQW